MQKQEPALSRPLDPLELIEHLPGKTFAASNRLRWVGVQAHRYREQPPNEALVPPLTYHSLLLFIRTPQELEVRSDVINRVMPPPVGSILMVPAGHTTWWRWGSHSDSLHVFLEPELVARVAAEAFEIEPARVSLPPLDGLQHPQLRAAMLAVNQELTTEGGGDCLAAASLANLLVLHLIRNASAPRLPARRRERALPRRKLRAVLEYIEEHLDTSLTLEQLGAVAQLSAYHFARQFKVATGVPPHQYVIGRRVGRAQQLLRDSDDRSLADVAAGAGFSDQSQLSTHFKRVVGVTPGHFRKSAGIA
jgi:AraC family transcriptional regulator